ncbi:unnamed protein product [Nippostrongylus brasiliensis]|uniref:Periphilin-1 n=1 Tax=Nippostrongylus brasiliensis TaxID=27835 RepID=A0A0N4YJY9_NIPBR|nr:unnamed protein product [Nippostrongylus brasiliensis]
MQPWAYGPLAEAFERGTPVDSDRGGQQYQRQERHYNDYYQRFEETSDSSRYYDDQRRGEAPSQRERKRQDSPNRYRNRSRSRSRDRRYSRGESSVVALSWEEFCVLLILPKYDALEDPPVLDTSGLEHF